MYIKIQIPYWIIVKDDFLCRKLNVNEYCVAEWLVDKNDTLTVEITPDKMWLLELLYEWLKDNENYLW